jgi:hypothetical protein
MARKVQMSKDRNKDKENKDDLKHPGEIDSFFNQWPWLRGQIDRERVERVSFKPIDLTLAYLSSEFEIGSFPTMPVPTPFPFLRREIFLYNRKGEFLGQVGKKKQTVTRRTWWSLGLWTYTEEIEVLFGETIVSALERILGARDIFFIVGIVPEDPQTPRGKGTLVVATLPQGQKNIFTFLGNEQRIMEGRVLEKLKPFFPNPEGEKSE